jgi:RND family efflux transporter MFP subunit
MRKIRQNFTANQYMNLKFLKSRKALYWGGAAVVVIASVAWYSSARTSQAATKYGLAAASKDTIVTMINGTGQVSGDQQLDVKPKANGTITSVAVKVGDKITTGKVLVTLDRTDALQVIRDASQDVKDAQVALTTAKLNLQKAQQPADAITVLQAENSLAKAKRDLETLQAGPTDFELQQAQADVDSAANNIKMTADGSMPQTVRDEYDQYVIALQSDIQTLETSRTDADGILGVDSPIIKNGLSQAFSVLNDSYKFNSLHSYDIVKQSNAVAKTAVDALSLKNESPDKIKAAADLVSTALTDMSDLLSDISDGLQATIANTNFTQSDLNSLKTTINSDKSNVNSKISSIASEDKSVEDAYSSYKNAQINHQKAVNSFDELKAGASATELATADEKVQEAQAQLDKVKAGTDPLDLRMEQISVDQKATALSNAQNKLADANRALQDYTVVAPFDGVVGAVTAQKNNEASSGSSLLTLVTDKKIVSISLNEVDSSTIAVGQKATITFDAIDSLSITGEVAEVSPIGSVSQGVVTYGIKVAFDSQDDRVKSGMSASVSIITEVHADVLTVPNAAVKVQGTQHYVQTLDTSTPAGADGLIETSQTPGRVIVEVGASNDTLTEITAGLKEGDRVISQTIKTTTGQTSTTGATGANSLLRAGSTMTGGAASGGNVRFISGSGPGG